jgi:hypothetical protein
MRLLIFVHICKGCKVKFVFTTKFFGEGKKWRMASVRKKVFYSFFFFRSDGPLKILACFGKKGSLLEKHSIAFLVSF